MCKGIKQATSFSIVPQSHSPARQAIVSIHFSSCPAPSSPWWLAWQGRMDWHICTATGPDPFLRPFSWDLSVSNTLFDQFWSMKTCSKMWSVEMMGGQSVSGLLSRQVTSTLANLDVLWDHVMWTKWPSWIPELLQAAGHYVSAQQSLLCCSPFMTHGLWCNHCVLLTCQSH